MIIVSPYINNSKLAYNNWKIDTDSSGFSSGPSYNSGNQGYNNNNYNNKGYDNNNNRGYNNHGGYNNNHNGGYDRNRNYGGKHRRIHHVTVGSQDGSLLRYTPPFVYARKHDIVRFEFLAKNHTVTQSDFDTPCQGRDGAFRTGFVPNPQGYRPGPKRDFVVRDDRTPAWFYCGQKQPRPHCGGGNEMVFAVNPPRRGNTFDRFAAKARASSIN